ncbi:MAG: NADP-dependent oxidoreductase, partial [Chitinispirillaceae bacterium]|nr:NADP-dependent oxidoreductase [Chitinispirillaceae bacterium]
PIVQWGTYAEYVTVPESSVSRKPSSLTFSEAAVVPLSGLTAYQSLFEAVDLRNGETILIPAAAGGVGSYAVQLAALQGARVIATARAVNHDYILALGASRVIDYTAEPYHEVVKAAYPGGVDAVFDLLGGDDTYTLMSLLKPKGRMVSILVPEQALDTARPGPVNSRYSYVFVRPESRQLDKLAALIEAGKLRIHIAASFPLEEAAKAHEMIEAGHVRGKIVLTME